MIKQKENLTPRRRKPMTRYAIKAASLVFLLLMLLFLPDVKAQNGTSSPFSIFGIGEIETRDFGRTAGMGNVGIGFQSENFLNRRNPAGLTGIDTLRFVFDVSAAIKFSEFLTKTKRNTATDFNFKNLAVGLRLTKRWTGSVGLSPYSNVGYRLKGPTQSIPGTNEYSAADFSGNGGVNKFFWANAYELFRGFSLGVTSSYIFGNVIHNEDQGIISNKYTLNINKMYFDFGMQYSHWFGENTNITIGGIYGYESEMPIQRTQTISSYTGTEQKRLPDLKAYVPESYGAGFSITRNQKVAEWILAADYKYQNWSVDRARHGSLAYTDSHIYSAGLQVTPFKGRAEVVRQLIRFQIGACYNQSYLKVNGFQQDDISVSLGVGIPLINQTRTLSYVNIAVNVGESRTGERGGINERYVLLSVNLSLIERWLAKYQWQ